MRWLLTTWFPRLLLVCAVAIVQITPSAVGEQPAGSVQPKAVPSLKDLLTRLKPLSPDEALKTFRIDKGFRIELVAAEPQVFSPVAMTWDEDGRLFVAEDIDYPEKPRDGQKPLGRIRLLLDSKGTGTYDKSMVYAEHVQWPAGIVPYKGGIFVAAGAQVLYLKDTKGDGKADVRQVVYEGFGTEVAERILNNLKWGLDHRIYGTAAGGGEVIRPTVAKDKPLTVRNRDIRFDPVTHQLDLLAGRGTFANCFDDWGNRYTSTPGMPLRQHILPGHYLGRNPYLAISAVSADLGQTKRKMFSISPPEPWKVVRQKFWERWVNTNNDMRASRFPAEELAPTGYVTGAAGCEIYRGTAFPKDYHGNSFTAEPAGNCVIRLQLQPAGVAGKAQPTSNDREFWASADNWFRPVNVVNGPDGCLYVCDMYREVIEFPSAIPDDILKIIDVTSGRDRGRIWRIAPEGFHRPAAPRLSKASTADLVGWLEHPDGWWRETAQRLLYERQDKAAVAPLRELVHKSRLPQARLHALYSLDGLAGLDEPTLLHGMADVHPGVREHAVRLAERFFKDSPKLRERVLALAEDTEPRVRFQVAFSLGEIAQDAKAQAALVHLLVRDGADRWITTAVLCSAGDCPAALFVQLLRDQAFLKTPSAADILGQLLGVVGARQRQAEIATILQSLVQPPLADQPALQQRALLGLADALARSGRSLDTYFQSRDDLNAVKELLAKMVQQAAQTAPDGRKPADERLLAIRLLRHAPFETARRVLSKFFTLEQPPDIQLAAIQALGGQSNAEVGKVLVENWHGISPRCRSEAVEVLFRDERRLNDLLGGLEQKVIQPVELPPQRQEALRKHPKAELRARAEKLFAGRTTASRRDALEKYQGVFKMQGDPVRGAQVFTRACAACHRLGNEGKNVGPDLATVARWSSDQLLVAILDPNREVANNYINYTITTRDGRVLTGIITAETAGSLTLRRAEGTEDTVLRTDIEALISTGQSLMPEGIEQQVDLQQMADLLRFITQPR